MNVGSLLMNVGLAARILSINVGSRTTMLSVPAPDIISPLHLRDDQPFLFKQFREDLDSQTALWNYEHHPALAAYAEEKLKEIQSAEGPPEVDA
jgi:hypothetical protein